ncbi:hypothetical protein RvY_07308-2 [Ramazzottius varieornatus]|uniref:Uncharacterized protein n=1 Tax=Ramazzottius varieornatus TaxID=947166 RepID=A0A1D1V1N7_RAMVA|nr:hypothetical protein RvY_07308-2 [Ramazzottius varieornatus]
MEQLSAGEPRRGLRTLLGIPSAAGLFIRDLPAISGIHLPGSHHSNVLRQAAELSQESHPTRSWSQSSERPVPPDMDGGPNGRRLPRRMATLCGSVYDDHGGRTAPCFRHGCQRSTHLLQELVDLQPNHLCPFQHSDAVSVCLVDHLRENRSAYFRWR